MPLKQCNVCSEMKNWVGEDGTCKSCYDYLREMKEQKEAYTREAGVERSTCCGYPIDPDFRICPRCKEHV